jgi:hypothetical protein
MTFKEFKNNKSKLACMICKTYEKDKAFHCSICNGCVVDHDHHCGVVANCINKENIW